MAEKNLTFINRGISGNRIIDLQGHWEGDVLDLKPNVLSIPVGINDTLWAAEKRSGSSRKSTTRC